MERIILYCSVGLQVFDCITTGNPGLIFHLSMDSVDQGVSCSQHPPFQPRFEVRQCMLAEEHPAPRPLPLTGGARGRDPNLAGHGREEHHITPQKKSNRIRLPSIPAKERMAKAKDPKARGIGKEYQSSSSKRRAWTRWNRGGWDWHRSWWKRCHDMEKNIWGLGVSYVSHLACRVAIISGSVDLLLDFHNGLNLRSLSSFSRFPFLYMTRMLSLG